MAGQEGMAVAVVVGRVLVDEHAEVVRESLKLLVSRWEFLLD